MIVSHFLKLIRFPNLLIIALSQYLLRYCILAPLVENRKIELAIEEASEPVFFDLSLTISHLNFFLLSLSTVLIAAAGYVINDYFDLKLDRINKPDKIIVGQFIKRRMAMGAHLVMNGMGLIIATYVAYQVGNLNLALIHVFAVISLWYYSTHFKYNFLSGNVIIALLAALIPLIVGLYEIPPLNLYMQDLSTQIGQVYNSNYNFNREAFWTIGFALFAFLMTMAREITKDLADIEGDEAYGAKTLPISWGEHSAKYFALFFYVLTALCLIAAPLLIVPLANIISLLYAWVILLIPIIYNAVKLLKAESKTDYLKSSNLNKLISLGGILYCVVHYFVFLA